MIPCKQCGHPNDTQASTCSHCNARLTFGAAPRQCPNGHIMEPGDTECVYCRNQTQAAQPAGSAGSPARRDRTEVVPDSFPAPQQGAGIGGGIYAARPASPPPSGGRGGTVVDPPPTPPAPLHAAPIAGRPQTPPLAAPVAGRPQTPPLAVPVAGRPATPAAPMAQRPPDVAVPRPQSAPAAATPRKTEFYSADDGMAPAAAPSGSPAAAPHSASRGRKIVGVLVTYSWRPEGQIFPVYEGRNLIGRGEECEISLPNDGSLSDRNSHISYQQRFVVGDLVSMSGTSLNGNAVLSQFEPLPDTATVRAGSTTFLFVSLLQYGGGPKP